MLCECHDDTVRIDMIPFMRKYRASQFQQWYNYWYGDRPNLEKDDVPAGVFVFEEHGFVACFAGGNPKQRPPSISAEDAFTAPKTKPSLKRKRGKGIQ